MYSMYSPPLPEQYLIDHLIFFFLMFIYFGERESIGEGQRKRGTEDLKPEIAESQWGAGNHEPWSYDLRQSQMLNQLGHPGTPNWPFSFLTLISWPWEYNCYLRENIHSIGTCYWGNHSSLEMSITLGPQTIYIFLHMEIKLENKSATDFRISS